MSRAWSSSVLALALGLVACDKAKPGQTATAKDAAPAVAPKTGTPYHVAKQHERILAMDAVVSKVQQQIDEAEAAGDVEALPELRIKLKVAQSALDQAKEKLRLMEMTYDIRKRDEQQKARALDGGS